MPDEIEVLPFDAAWCDKFKLERLELKKILPSETILGLEHFGSTAIPDMPAKPIIDILIAVRSIEAARDAFPTLMDELGYDFWADNSKQDRLFFVKGMPPRGTKRTHHVHVCEKPSEMWGQLIFRDYMISNPKEAAEYALLKRQLAAEHSTDREAYTQGKDEFISKIMKVAISISI